MSAMNYAYSVVISIALIFGIHQQVYGTHAMGLDLTYERVGADSFLVTLAFYRDCAGVNAANSYNINVRSATCGYNFNESLPRVGTAQETTPVCASLTTQCSGGTFPGSEEYVYQKIIVLPAQCDDWFISNRICCRNNGITTINNPGSQSIYVETTIDNTIINNSPIFSNNPVPFVCSDQSYCFNNGAVDPDGDSLVYSLVTPRTNTGVGDTVTFNTGFTKSSPITSNPALSIDSSTGDICMFPTDSTEIGVMAILVEEYRNGVKIGSIMRDIQMRIIGCPNGNTTPSVSGINGTNNYTTKVCANTNLTFSIFANDPDTGQTITMTWNGAITGATFNTSGNPPTGVFSWTPTLADVRNQPHCFTVEVSDDNCPFNAAQTFSYCITVVGITAIVDSIIDPTCIGDCDGRAGAEVLNGISPITYLWNDPLTQTSSVANNLCAGTYTVVGTDSTGCSTSIDITIDDPDGMVAFTSNVPTSCNGDSDGLGIVDSVQNGTAPISYLWEVAAGSQTTDTAFGLAAGTYTVTVTDSNNCSIDTNVTVTEPLILDATAGLGNNVSCFGLNDGKAFATGTGGTAPYAFSWDSAALSQTTDTAFNLLAGTYVVTLTDTNGCMDTASVTITEPGSSILLSLSTTDVDCYGDSSGSATVVPTGGTPPYNFNWDAGTGNQTTATASNLPAGIYTIIVTDSNNCTAIPNVTILQPDSGIQLIPSLTSVQCNGDTDGVAFVTVSGGTLPYSYSWDASAGSQTTDTAINLGAGNYTITVTDSLGCMDDTIASIVESAVPLIMTGNKSDVTCNNGSDGQAYVSLSGGSTPYVITWDSAAGNQTTDTAFNLRASTVNVNVTDSLGCSLDTNFVITEPAALITLVTAASHVTCFGDSNGFATVVPSGGTPPYNYLWDANANNQTTDTAFGLIAGSYTVTVSDSFNCVVSPGINILEPSSPVTLNAVIKDVNCFAGNDGYAAISAVGGTPGYTYMWDTAAASQITDTAFNLSTGNYQVTVTDSFNCVKDTIVTVAQPAFDLTMTFNTTSVNCFGGNDAYAVVLPAGGTAPYTVLWDTATGSQTTDTAMNLSDGRYFVDVTDSLGCVATDSVDINQPDEPLVAPTSSILTSCFGSNDGQAVVQPSGGTTPYGIQWDASAFNQVTDTAFGLTAGTYSVTITDSNSCDTMVNVTVDQPDAITDSIFVSSDFNGSGISCFGNNDGSATVIAFGGTPPYTYAWDSSAAFQTGDTAFNLGEGIYTVTITDTNGCTGTDFISIASPGQISFVLSNVGNVSCNGDSNGTVTAVVVGGTPGFQYLWNTTPAQTEQTASNLPAGTYMVTITDTNGCTGDTTVSITEPTVLTSSIIGYDVSCNGGDDGVGAAQPQGGTPPYSYLWTEGGGSFQFTDTAMNLAADTHHLTVTDSLGCSVDDSVIISEPPLLELTVGVGDTICEGETAILTANATGGTGTIVYNWSHGLGNSNTHNVSPTTNTSYILVAMDSKGCNSLPGIINIFIRDFVNDTLGITADQSICLGDSATISALHNGPYGGYTYTWNVNFNGLGPFTVTPDSTTTYEITVSDICGNAISDSTTVSILPVPDVGLPAQYASGCLPLTVTFEDTVNSMTGLTYLWTYGDGNGSPATSPTYTYTSSGTFNVGVIIQTSDGCSVSSAENGIISQVEVYPKPTADFTPDKLTSDSRNFTFMFTNGSNGANLYEWDFGDGDTSMQVSPSHTYPDTGSYIIQLIATTNQGCADTTISDIRINPYYTITIPSAFTPNPGGSSGGKYDPLGLTNDVFFPHTEGVSDYQMLIFNRWGEVIFESTDHAIGWDGYYRGRLSAQEVYVYKIKVKWENGQEFEQVGDLTLFR